MMVRTSELSGAALDWAVAKCEGFTFKDNGEILKCYKDGQFLLDWNPADRSDCGTYAPSIHWAQGGPIIERERIELTPPVNGEADRDWMSVQVDDEDIGHLKVGPTPLIAAMRCYVASKLGDEVEIPKEILS